MRLLPEKGLTGSKIAFLQFPKKCNDHQIQIPPKDMNYLANTMIWQDM